MKENNNITRSIKYQKEDIKLDSPQREDEEELIEVPSHPLLKKILISIFLIIIVLIVYSCFIETSIFRVKEYKVESTSLPSEFNGLKIVHFSDIHYGTTINKKQLDKIVTKINDLNPDIIVFTGNLIDKNITLTENIEQEVIESLSNLKCSLYKYAIYGNEDILNNSYKDIIEKMDFKLLDNESTLLYYKGITPILITGFNSKETNPNYTILTNLVDEIDSETLYKIVLSHEPDSIDSFSIYHPDLVLSGNSLGGLINIPFMKPLFLSNGSKKYYKDYYKINNTDFYISNGLGTSGLNARFNNTPSINLYRLYMIKG